MLTDFFWLKRLRQGLTVAADKLVQSYWTPSGEFLVVAIMVPLLVVGVALLGNALGLPVVLSLAVATILAWVAVSPYMLRLMHSSTPTETDDTLSTAQTSPATDAVN